MGPPLPFPPKEPVLEEVMVRMRAGVRARCWFIYLTGLSTKERILVLAVFDLSLSLYFVLSCLVFVLHCFVSPNFFVRYAKKKNNKPLTNELVHFFHFIWHLQWQKMTGLSSEQDKTRQDKTRQDKTRQDKTRQDKTRQDKTKTRQDKTKQ